MSEPDVLTYVASIEQKLAEMLPILRDRLPRGGSRASGPVLSDEMTCRECGGTGTVPQAERLFPSGASEGDVDDPLVKYAHHLPGCAYLAPYGENDPEPECDCGLNEAISSALSAPGGGAVPKNTNPWDQIQWVHVECPYCTAKDEELRKLRKQVEDADEALAACRAEAGGRIETLERERDEARAADGEATSLLRELDAAKAELDAALDEARRMREALEAFPVSPPRGTAGFSSFAGTKIRDWFHDHHKPALDAALTPAPGKGVDRE